MTAPNWFVALPVPAQAWLEALTAPPVGARLFASDDVHITLAFLGPVGEERARAAWEAARRLPPASPFRFLPGALSPFGPRRRPSAWAVEPLDGAPRLAAFIEAARGPVAEAAGCSVDPRAVRPHATLVRPRRGAAPAVHRALATWAVAQALPVAPVELDRLALYTWAEDRRRRLFRVVASRPLWP